MPEEPKNIAPCCCVVHISNDAVAPAPQKRTVLGNEQGIEHPFFYYSRATLSFTYSNNGTFPYLSTSKVTVNSLALQRSNCATVVPTRFISLTHDYRLPKEGARSLYHTRPYGCNRHFDAPDTRLIRRRPTLPGRLTPCVLSTQESIQTTPDLYSTSR